MELNQLRYFLVVCEEGNLSRAARRLFLSQPSLSEQMKKLERELGTALFERLPRQFALTSAGEILKPHVERILGELADAKLHVAQIAADGGSSIRIGVLPTVGIRMLPPVIADFRAKLPDVKLILREENSSESVANLLSHGELDVGVIRKVGNGSGLSSRALLREPLVLLTPKDHPFSCREEVPLEELRDEPFLTLHAGHGLRNVVLRALAGAGIRARIIAEVGEVGLLVALVQAGMGITILPAMAVDLSPLVAVVSIKDVAATRELHVVWRSAHAMADPVRTFIESLETHARTSWLKNVSVSDSDL